MTPKNISYDFKSLKKQGMVIWSKRRLSNFVFQYGQTRVLSGYAACLVDTNGKFLPKVTSSQLMRLVKFDQKLGACILKYLWDFEQRLNSVLVATLLAEYGLSQNYVLDVDHCDWLNFKNAEEKENFKRNMYQNVETCNFLKYYKDKQNIPLISLSLSWTFFNTLLFFDVVNPNVQLKVIKAIGLENWTIEAFRSIGHIIRKIRNTISHNDCLLISRWDANESLNKQMNLGANNKHLFIYDICEFLDLISTSRKSLVKSISKLINHQFFSKPVRQRVGKLLGWDLSKIRVL